MFNMVPGTTFQICPKNKRGSSVIDCPLNKEEIDYFENKSKSGMSFDVGDLSPHVDGRKNFWRSKRSKIVLTDKPRELDLSTPKDYMDYKILLSNSDFIAPSLDKEFDKLTFVYVMISEDEVQKKAVEKGGKSKRAWKIAGKMEDDRDQMIDYLTVIGKRPGAKSKLGFLQGQINDQVETNINEFLEILEDAQYATRVVLTKSIQNKSVIRDGYKHFLAGGDELVKKGETNTLVNVLNYLDDDANQDIRLTLEAKINK